MSAYFRCCISDASTAVRLDSMPCSLHADACTFHNLKECIATRGGGDVMVYTSTFEQTDTALKLDDTVTLARPSNATLGRVRLSSASIESRSGL